MEGAARGGSKEAMIRERNSPRGVEGAITESRTRRLRPFRLRFHRLTRVLQQQDLAEVAGEVPDHEMDHPPHFELARLAVRTRSRPNDRQVGVLDADGDALQMFAGARQQIVVER